MKRKKDESGNCLVIIGVIFALLLLLVMCNVEDTDDCYATPGAEPGSAQGMRDQDRCIRG